MIPVVVVRWESGKRAAFSKAASPPSFPPLHRGGKLCRGSIGQRRVRAVVVVVPPPQMQLPAGVGQGEEDLHVQTLVAQLAVEAFDVAVLHRLAMTG